MAIDGLDDLVNKFDSTTKDYDANLGKYMQELEDYKNDKMFSIFFDKKLTELGVTDPSTIPDSEKLNKIKILANDKALEQVKNGETKQVKDKNGNDKTVLVNAFDDFEKEYKLQLSKKENIIKIITQGLNLAQTEQAKLLDGIDEDLEKIKNELDERKNEDKKLEEEKNEIENNESKFDKEIEEMLVEINANNDRIEQIHNQMEKLARRDASKIDLQDEMDKLNEINRNLSLKIGDRRTQKVNRLADIEKERNDLKIKEYTTKYNDLNERVISAKEKYQENSIKITEQYKEMGLDPKEIANSTIKMNNPEQIKQQDKDTPASRGVQKDNNSPENTVSFVKSSNPSNSLEPTDYVTKSSFDKASSFANIENPEDGLNRLANTNDFSDIMATLRDPSKNGKLKKTSLRETLAMQAEFLNNNMRDPKEHMASVENALGRKLTKDEVATLENMFDEKMGKQYLKGDKEYSKSELLNLTKIINDVAKREDLTPEQREAFSKDFLQYAQLNCFNRQNDKVAVTKFFENKFSLGRGKAQKGLEESISNYTKQAIEKDRESKDNFFNNLHNGRLDNPRYAEISEPEKSRQRESRTR